MVVKHGNINRSEVHFSVFHGFRRQRFIAMLAQNRGAQQEIVLRVIEQEHADWLLSFGFSRCHSAVEINVLRTESSAAQSFFPGLERSALANSGSLLKTAVLRSHCLWSNAGEPLTMEPSGMSPCVPLCAVMTTLSPILQCPATPTRPARTALRPTSVHPPRPTCAHNMVFSPTTQF